MGPMRSIQLRLPALSTVKWPSFARILTKCLPERMILAVFEVYGTMATLAKL